jgi:hypothetical protein
VLRIPIFKLKTLYFFLDLKEPDVFPCRAKGFIEAVLWIRIILESWIRIRIRVKGRIRIRIKVKSRIRIRINVMRIRNTA